MKYQTYRYGEPHPCLLVNPKPATPVMTVLIVGVPRGGTTMAAAVVDALGVDLGPAKDLYAFTFEDQGMTKADPGLQLSYIRQRNRERKVWGWKMPTAISSIRENFHALQQPRMIMVFRDVVASIDGEMRFDVEKKTLPLRTFADLAEVTLKWWTNNMEFIATTAMPMLLVSYERALQSPESFIHSVAAFLGIVPPPEMVQEALARVNTCGGYLRINEQGQPIPVVVPLPETNEAPVLKTPPPKPEAKPPAPATKPPEPK